MLPWRMMCVTIGEVAILPFAWWVLGNTTEIGVGEIIYGIWFRGLRKAAE